eukprot:scaffold75323_cov21-Phaeocystis_antarctica.AAC.1
MDSLSAMGEGTTAALDRAARGTEPRRPCAAAGSATSGSEDGLVSASSTRGDSAEGAAATGRASTS